MLRQANSGNSDKPCVRCIDGQGGSGIDRAKRRRNHRSGPDQVYSVTHFMFKCVLEVWTIRNKCRTQLNLFRILLPSTDCNQWFYDRLLPLDRFMFLLLCDRLKAKVVACLLAVSAIAIFWNTAKYLDKTTKWFLRNHELLEDEYCTAWK